VGKDHGDTDISLWPEKDHGGVDIHLAACGHFLKETAASGVPILE